MHWLVTIWAILPLASSTIFEPVKMSKTFNATKPFSRSFAAFSNTNVFANLFCKGGSPSLKIKIRWSLHYIYCAKRVYGKDDSDYQLSTKDPCEWSIENDFIQSDEKKSLDCTQQGEQIHLTSEKDSKFTSYQQCHNDSRVPVHHHSNASSDALVATWKSGVYVFFLEGETVGPPASDWSIDLKFEVKTPSGDHLSATNWPLLPFWGCMCAFYAFMALMWLVLCGWYWRDLLRLQMWIGAVIFLGMVESAVFLGEIDNINRTGEININTNIAGEIVSAFKRTLARMLVIIVSLGYGIVKPQLGPALPKVIIFGVCFFIAASIYGVVNVLNLQFESVILYASIPVSIVDAVAAWWIFSSLIETTRLLRIRRNVIKLSLYRHFINTLALCLLAAVAFMVWSIRLKVFKECPEWSWWWLEDAYWPMLFSVILLVICVLWRPSQNNQRYAFSPLRDCDDEEEDNLVVTELYDHIKPRSMERQKLLPGQQASSDAEDDLKWVEENIPSSMPDALIDNDEERKAAQYELSKMQ